MCCLDLCWVNYLSKGLCWVNYPLNGLCWVSYVQKTKARKRLDNEKTR